MNVNIEKTKKYYHSIDSKSLCDCNYCKNYYAQIKADYPAVASYLASLGIDIEKPFDVSPLEPENGILEYCACWYIVFGSCPDTYRYKIGDVDFCVASAHPSTGIEEEHFVLEFSPIRLNILSHLAMRGGSFLEC
jgi:hypothetical protein